MMYPFMTLNDGTETTHSEIKPAKAHLIQGAFALSNAEEVAPYPDELAARAAY